MSRKMSLVLESTGSLSAQTWNLLGNDADIECSDVDADAEIVKSVQTVSVLFATCDSDEHYWLTTGSMRNASGVLEMSSKSLGFFCNQESGNPVLFWVSCVFSVHFRRLIAAGMLR